MDLYNFFLVHVYNLVDGSEHSVTTFQRGLRERTTHTCVQLTTEGHHLGWYGFRELLVSGNRWRLISILRSLVYLDTCIYYVDVSEVLLWQMLVWIDRDNYPHMLCLITEGSLLSMGINV